jgi:acetolactate synthase I/II/III large subunit
MACRLPGACLTTWGSESIRDLQTFRCDGRCIATDFGIQPDFAQIAAASGCHGEFIDNPADIERSLKRALEANTRGIPAVVQFRVAPDRLRQSRDYFNLYYPGEA